ncbi:MULTISPECIES: SIR2 family protein [Rhodopseudomonas]|uniref:Transcriptional regulator n=1 Tax=Rhodopseudomonas palustris TaxID=1076 RepID=A0A0D7E518_RHOPL|nr:MULTISPECIES: SIR2 family protein [Rhodopseudomonas]KIZ34677.1 transcriptional regulator [Rhodopseudomonas palustris]MDF3810971.1 SIR2 family protein [Rhodopseudomonas sp. BAL398]WOK15873.1 SIR2 family protein [Rhodopseudomonas sp. BAL398]
MSAEMIDDIAAGRVIPYLGAGVLALADEGSPPGTPAALVARLTAKTTVPHKVRNNLTGAAQYIENFKHRKTLTSLMTAAFQSDTQPTALHRQLAALPALPLLVHAWYDDLPQKALAGRSDWGMAQGVSQTEHFGRWVHYFGADGGALPEPVPSIVSDEEVLFAPAPDQVADWATLLYQPLGSVAPAANYLVSDSDFVEVMTEIDIQTPVPLPVQILRKDRHFLFLGCRFDNQLDRVFARQIMKRSSDRHWAVLPEPPSRYEARFLEEQNIRRIEWPLAKFVAALAEAGHDHKQPA